MGRGDATIAAGLLVLVALCSSYAAKPQGDPDKEAAVAVAIRAEFSVWLEVDTTGSEIPVCLDREVPVNVEAIAANLSKTVFRPIAVEHCSSKTIEGDFGMFTALTTYYDPSGNEAAHLEIAAVDCPSTSVCIVDIDAHGAGMRYKVERKGQAWTVTSQDLRWIV